MSFNFDVGRYAVYIWPAYAITAAVLVWMIAASLLAARRWRAEAERLQAAADAQKPAAKP